MYIYISDEFQISIWTERNVPANRINKKKDLFDLDWQSFVERVENEKEAEGRKLCYVVVVGMWFTSLSNGNYWLPYIGLTASKAIIGWASRLNYERQADTVRR